MNRFELNALNKTSLVNLICKSELLNKINTLNDISFASVAYVERVGLALVKEKHAFQAIVESEIDGLNGDLVIRIKNPNK